MAEKFEPRIINPENKNPNELLDGMIVVPALGEEMDIIRNIFFGVRQGVDKGRDFVHGIVIVINQRPSAKEKYGNSNFETLKLLRYLQSGIKVSKRGDKDFDYMVGYIQKSKVPIFVLDAFTEGFMTEKMNVGYARKLGTDFAMNKLKGPRSFVVSTDADTILDYWVMQSVHNIMQNTRLDAGPLNIGKDLENLSKEELRAYRAEQVFWNLKSATTSAIYRITRMKEFGIFMGSDVKEFEESAIYLCGSGSYFSKEGLEESGGYDETLGYGEDTGMIHALKKVKDMTDVSPGLLAFTKPRYSTRPENGYGYTVLKYKNEENKMHFVQVESYKSIAESAKFKDALERLLDKNFDRKFSEIGQEFEELCDGFRLENSIKNKLLQLFIAWDGKANSKAHHDFLTTIHDTFKDKYPKESLTSILFEAEDQVREFSQAIKKTVFYKTIPENVKYTVDYDSFCYSLLQVFETFSLDGFDHEKGEDNLRVKSLLMTMYMEFTQKITENFRLVASLQLKYTRETGKTNNFFEDKKDLLGAILQPGEVGRMRIIMTLAETMKNFLERLGHFYSNESSKKFKKELNRLIGFEIENITELDEEYKEFNNKIRELENAIQYKYTKELQDLLND